MCKKIKKGIIDAMDEFIEPLKLFGHPIEDFQIDKMTPEERKEFLKIQKMKIERLAS